jgi:serine/threonine protein kinase
MLEGNDVKIEEQFEQWFQLMMESANRDSDFNLSHKIQEFGQFLIQKSIALSDNESFLRDQPSQKIWWDSLEGKPIPENEHMLYKYELIKQISSGGFGGVYLANDLILDRKVALKVLSPDHLEDKKTIAKFIREIFNAASLEHSNIIRIYELGSSNRLPYATMEYIDGEDLRETVISVRQFNLSVMRTLFIQVCKALEFIHRKGFIHCDVKPENILIDREGSTKLTDFSLLKPMNESVRPSTETLWGTPTYMAPEIIEGSVVDQRADIYSLGILLYEMRTGVPPFEGSDNEILQHHLLTKPRRPSIRVLDMSKEEEQIIMRCLEKKPELRYETVSEILKDFRNLDLTQRFAEIQTRGNCYLSTKEYCDKPTETQRTLIPVINYTGSPANALFDQVADETIRNLEYESIRMERQMESPDDICRFCQWSSSARAAIANISTLSPLTALQIGMMYGNEKRVLLVQDPESKPTFFNGIFRIKTFTDERSLARIIRKFIARHDEEIRKTADCFFRWEFHCKSKPKPNKKQRVFIAVPPNDENERQIFNNAVLPGLSEMNIEPILLPLPGKDLKSTKQIYDNLCATCRGIVTAQSAIIDVSNLDEPTAFVLGTILGTKRKLVLVHREGISPPENLIGFNIREIYFFRDIIDVVNDYLL